MVGPQPTDLGPRVTLIHPLVRPDMLHRDAVSGLGCGQGRSPKGVTQVYTNGLVTKEWFQVGSTNAYTGGRHVCAGEGAEAILAVLLRRVKGWWAYVVKTELRHHPNL